MSLATTQAHRESLQRQTQADWVNREYIELITGSIKRIADFLNSFDMSCRFAFGFLFLASSNTIEQFYAGPG